MGGRWKELQQGARREAGARVTTNTRLADLNLPAVQRMDDRRIELEVIANGVTPQQNHGPGEDNTQGQHSITCPELATSGRCRLVVLGLELGGRRSQEAASFIALLARARARHPEHLRQSVIAALISRWTALLSHAAFTAFALRLPSLRMTLPAITTSKGNCLPGVNYPWRDQTSHPIPAECLPGINPFLVPFARLEWRLASIKQSDAQTFREPKRARQKQIIIRGLHLVVV